MPRGKTSTAASTSTESTIVIPTEMIAPSKVSRKKVKAVEETPVVVEAAPVVVEEVKPSRSKRSKAVVAAPVVQEVVAPEPAVVLECNNNVCEIVGDVNPRTLKKQNAYNYILELNSAISAVLPMLSKEQLSFVEFAKLKSLVTKNSTRLRECRKALNIKAPKSTRPNSGFNNPLVVSNQLAEFMGQKPGFKVSRQDVNKFLHEYIMKNENYDKTDPSKPNRRNIIPDAKLAPLFRQPEDENGETTPKPITFFSMQGMLSHHYPPKVVKVKQPKAEAATA
jgi:chromatin remodeling complex protein RSC6